MSETNKPTDLDTDLLGTIFFEKSKQFLHQTTEENQRFVHYTSAEAAVGIIQGGSFWFRKVTTMNDYMEVQYGRDCLITAYQSSAGEKLKEILNQIYSEFTREFEDIFNKCISSFCRDIYIASFSHHLESEDVLGRLSMWRAYGGDNGVALVFNNTAFVSVSDALRVYSHPVDYFGSSSIAEQIESLTTRINENRKFLASLGREVILDYLFYTFKFMMIYSKHPGFSEEKELRVIFDPFEQVQGRLDKAVEVIRGVPQIVYKLPFKNYTDEGLNGMDLGELLNRIIIGPCKYPDVIREALVEVLKNKNISDPEKKVVISDIPLRN